MIRIERRTLVLLCGSSCVGKTTLIQYLQSQTAWETYRISARDAIKGAPHHFGAYPPYEQMISSAQVGLDIQKHIYQNFKNNLRDLATNLVNGDIKGKYVVTERCLYDPILYTLTYYYLGGWDSSKYYRDLVRHFLCCCIAEHVEFVQQLLIYGFNVHTVYVPIQPDVIPYDTQGGARPPIGVRDMFDTAFKDNRLLFHVDLELEPGTPDDYIREINNLVFNKRGLT